MKKDKEYVKTTIKIPRDTWMKIRKLQQSRHVRSIQHAVELGLQWVVATAKERRRGELNGKNHDEKG
jgi:hypothetical protein